MNEVQTTPKLTRKQKVFVREIIANPKQPAYKAAQAAYNVSNENSAAQLASKNLSKPNIMMYLVDRAEKAEMSLFEVMDYSTRLGRKSPAYAGVAVAAAKDVLDRVHGKPTQRVEQSSTTLAFTIDLSGMSLSDDVPEEANAD